MGGFDKVRFDAKQKIKEAPFPGGFSLHQEKIRELGESKDCLICLLARGVG